MLNIKILPAYDYAEDVCQLFMEYTDMMVEGDSEFAGYLKLQNYDEEMKSEIYLCRRLLMMRGRLAIRICF